MRVDLLSEYDVLRAWVNDTKVLEIIGSPWPWPPLNRITRGMRVPYYLTVLLAPPGVGKSLIANQVVKETAASGRRVAYVSTEMVASQLLVRWSSDVLDVSWADYERDRREVLVDGRLTYMALTAEEHEKADAVVRELAARVGLHTDVHEVDDVVRALERSSRRSGLCWSAVSTSVARFYEPASSWTQCALVNEAFGQSACCREGSSAACNQPWFLERALALVQHLEKDFGGAQDMDAIAAQVAAGRPLGLCIDWTGGGGHFVVLDACDPAAGTVQVCDPMFGTSTVPLAAFPSSYQGGGTWSWTYLTRPRGEGA